MYFSSGLCAGAMKRRLTNGETSTGDDRRRIRTSMWRFRIVSKNTNELKIGLAGTFRNRRVWHLLIYRKIKISLLMRPGPSVTGVRAPREPVRRWRYAAVRCSSAPVPRLGPFEIGHKSAA